ncbi:hypothetical protein JIN77_07495 [Verrucomicrobiaceae bacterium R5-34]|uniref:Lipoprotein n=1 Tax=Oceaniferula flava TaxID=2800421 RepID=A0AAE2SE49_9BACT|nr:hypothetical protein [Oceaniferula flavus]MBK1830565.1 hypothetical protein [Verrucomicrobiaceae bacterium R5-34]MBK1854661.1 hypothetical protein [Oceaniferula flavus]MBM1135967.1 hypothetical protein [Oceaniferula flavus]
MKTQLLIIATSLLSLFGLTSCFQSENTITVNKDGSGTIVEETFFGEQMQMMIQMAEAQGGQGGNPLDQMTDPTKAKARAQAMGEGVELVGIEKINVDGKIGMRATFKFADINKLKYSSAGALDMGDLPGGAAGAAKEAEDAGVTFKLADGKLSIIQKTPEAEGADKAEDGGAAEVPEMDPQQLAMMQGVMKDMRITMKVKIASGIAKTDATHVDGDTITLGDIKMDKLLANPEKLKALQGGDFDQTKEAMKGVEGVKFEGKEVVEVEMK